MQREPSPAFDPQEEEMILDGIERFLERDVRPYVAELEANDTYPEDIVTKMKELGLFGATISADYGGLGLPATT
ncbi:MAG: acyl-CoA dehydrogenase family protein, partial [Rhodospirillaceae bacterium]|nr:acyl-CoA dehydrogenase family protein [Rhodospirillaceae bacterium]